MFTSNIFQLVKQSWKILIFPAGGESVFESNSRQVGGWMQSINTKHKCLLTLEWDWTTNYLLSEVRLLLCFSVTFSCYFAYPNLAARSLYSSFWHSHKNSDSWVCFLFVFFLLLLHLCSFSLTLNSPLTRDLRYFPPACTFSALHSSFLLQSAVRNQERVNHSSLY